MTADTRPAVDPKTLVRMDALPGSLGKVTLCAVFTLGIAAFVSVRSWLSARTTENHNRGSGETVTKYGFRGKGKTAAAGSGGADSGSGSGGCSAASAGRGEGGTGGSGGAPSPAQHPQLPQRNYYTIRASLHVKRHNAKMMEWFDAQLGLQLPFSQQLFELRQEERQAPLILLSFRTLREATHRMAVTIEELYDTQTAAAYCEASLSRITDCARVLGTSTTRVGSKEYPAAEYCYVDETQTMVFVFSLFVVHERLAVTLQYVAPTRVRNVLPTGFFDVARYLTFTAPSPSPSYLLISEPRLGLGYHLPLDFLVHEGLAESDGVEDRLFTAVGGGGGGNSAAGPMLGQHARGAVGGSANTHAFSPGYGGGDGRGEGNWMIPYATAMSRGGRRMGLITSYEPFIGGNSSGRLGMAGGTDPSSTAAAAACAGVGGSSGGNGGGVPYAWRPYLEQQVCKAVHQLGLVMGSDPEGNHDSGGGGGSGGPRVVFQGPDPSDPSTYANSAQTLLIEPYPLSVTLNGNFSAGDDGREEDSEVMNVTAFSLFREVRVDVNSSYVTLVPDTLDAAAAAAAANASRTSAGCSGGPSSSSSYSGTKAGVSPATVRAYWSAFYVPVGTACVSFHFIASSLRHTSTEFVSFCAAVMNSVSLGNHYGQAVSVLYCNTRHDVLPFRLSLPPTGMATVEEPMLADPLCVVQATYGVEKLAVTVRVFPLFSAMTSNDGACGGGDNANNSLVTTTGQGAAAGGVRSGTPAAVGARALSTPTAGSLDARSTSSSKQTPSTQLLRPAERRGTRQRSVMRQLQYMIRYYLTQLPGGGHIVSYAKTTVNAMPAVVLCFRPMMWYADDDGSGGGDAAPLSSSAAATTINNWDDFSGGVGGGGSSSQGGASSWLETREAMLEDEVGQLNPFAQYFAAPPPPASYLWGQQQQQQLLQGVGEGNSSSSQGQQMTSAAVKKAGMAPTGDAEGDTFYSRGAGDSQRSQEELGDPLRVAVAVCCEGNVFLFQTSASEYTLGIAQEAVRATATYLALIPRGG